MTKQASPAQELFYRDDQFHRQDADLHEPILAGGDHAAAFAVSRVVMKRLGFSDAQITALLNNGETR